MKTHLDAILLHGKHFGAVELVTECLFVPWKPQQRSEGMAKRWDLIGSAAE
jgi:hypothetical protein